MITRAERTRILALAFLRCTECKAVPMEDVEAVLMRVERFGAAVIFHFLHDHDADPDPSRDGDRIPVRYFAEVQEILERRRWVLGLLDA